MDAETTRRALYALLLAGAALTAAADAATPATPATPATSWSLKGPTALAIEPGGRVPISIVLPAGQATNPTIFESTLAEVQAKKLLDPGLLKLCAATCDKPVVSIGKSTVLWLKLDDAVSFGKYTGTLTITSDEKPAGEDINLTVYVSNPWVKLAGVAVIFLSVVAAWFFTVFTRNLLNRYRLLLPVAQLRSALERLAAANTSFHRATTLPTLHLTKIINDQLDRALTLAELEAHGLPARFPSTWAVTAAPTVSDLQTYLGRSNDWVTALTIVLDALNETLTLRASVPAPNFAATVERLDDLLAFADAPKAEQLAKDANAALADLRKAVHGITALPPSPEIGVPAARQLNTEIGVLNVASWSFVAIATTLTGAAALIYFSDGGPGFGTSRDFLTCILWGFGLPAGANLTGSTTSTVTTAFSIAKPS